MEEKIARLKKSIRRRAEIMAQEAVGRPFAVRVGRNEVNHGTITHVEVLDPVFTGRTVSARFRVHYAVGTLNFSPIVVTSLPR